MQLGSSQAQPFNSNTHQIGQHGHLQRVLQSNLPFQQNPLVDANDAPIPPLDRSRFETVYKHFCTQRSLVHNARLMSLETRPIDLYELHSQVILAGGAANVTQKDLWAVIGGQMGFVMFPASDREPAKSGPRAAQHLAHVYKEYLAAFDNIYVGLMESRRKSDAALRGTNNSAHGPAMRSDIFDPTQTQLVLGSASIPLVELRRRGIAEELVQFIEANRPTLLQIAAEQATPTGFGT
ncbi:hypothetical protein FB451DRAFT_1040476 [Mycena latifolia]|nr:hypothetical protein FB451DRAFT_1040476 [Mycena latifolia]